MFLLLFASIIFLYYLNCVNKHNNCYRDLAFLAKNHQKIKIGNEWFYVEEREVKDKNE